MTSWLLALYLVLPNTTYQVEVEEYYVFNTLTNCQEYIATHGASEKEIFIHYLTPMFPSATIDDIEHRCEKIEIVEIDKHHPNP